MSASNRNSKGRRVALISLGINLLLFLIKLGVSLWIYSLTVIGDAINNLADFLTSLITLFSFRIAGRPADREHPFGHARTEYIATLFVASFIVLVGGQLIYGGFQQFFLSSEHVDMRPITIFVLLSSVILKLLLFAYQRKIATELDSLLLRAAANDSLSDVYVGSGLVIATFCAYLWRWNIDALIGMTIGILIIFNGYTLIRQTCDNLLGNRAPKQLRREIRSAVEAYPGVLGVHDLMIHDYGPGNCYASIHVEVDAAADLVEVHDQIDEIERDIRRKYNVQLLIHIDPMLLNDELTECWRSETETICREIDEKCFMHEFRCRELEDSIELRFDLAVPDRCTMDNHALRKHISERLRAVQDQRSNSTITREEMAKPVKAYITNDRNYATDLAKW